MADPNKVFIIGLIILFYSFFLEVKDSNEEAS
jgi:hypothetical protein